MLNPNTYNLNYLSNNQLSARYNNVADKIINK